MIINKKIYQIYYNKEQEIFLNKNLIPFYNDEFSIFFENEVILHLSENLKNNEYFGVISWKFENKNNRILDIGDLNDKYNFYLFNGITINQEVFKIAEYYHPNFNKLFDFILDKINIKINKDNVNLGIYQNAIIAKGNIYNDYIDNYLLPAIEVMEDKNNVDFYNDIWKKCDYRDGMVSDINIMKKNFNINHYTFHTFLLERLWSVYYELNKNKLKVKYL